MKKTKDLIDIVDQNTMQNTKHIMCDIETLGTAPGAVIFEIAAAEFDMETGEIFRFFAENVSIRDAQAQGLHIEMATVAWWNQRGGLPNSTNLVGIVEALDMFAFWLKDVGPTTTLWGWGGNFDFTLLEAAFRICKKVQGYPWKYSQISDARTVWKLAFGDRLHAERSHTAIEDVGEQIVDLIAAIRELKASGKCGVSSDQGEKMEGGEA